MFKKRLILKNNTRLKARVVNSYEIWLLLLIPVVFTIIFNYVPMFGIVIAFQDYKVSAGFAASKWVGFKHFLKFFHSTEFWRVVRNTLNLSVYGLIAGSIMPVILAISLNTLRSKHFRGFIQTVTYLPHFISVVVFVGIIFQIFDPRIGFVNNIREAFGLERMNFMANPNYFDDMYVWSGVWQGMGFGAIVYLAVLANIDSSLYEAATIDGASILQKIKYIEIPLIIPTFILLFVLALGGILSIGFEKVFLMQNTINMSKAEVISTYVYRRGLQSSAPSFSYATAIGLFQSVIGLILLLSVNRISKLLGQKALW